MMKKTCFLILACALSLNLYSPAYADYSYDIGRAIGNSMGDAMGAAGYRGDIDKNFFIEENFDFSTINSFLVLARILPETANYVTDPYIANKMPKIIKNQLSEKYNIKTMDDVTKQYFLLHPEAIHLTQEQQTQNIVQFANETCDAIIFINVHAYFTSGRSNNAKIEFNVNPMGVNYSVFNYLESRLNVERGTKERTLATIIDHFNDKFKDTFENIKDSK